MVAEESHPDEFGIWISRNFCRDKKFTGRMTHLSSGPKAGVYLVIEEKEGHCVWRRWGGEKSDRREGKQGR